MSNSHAFCVLLCSTFYCTGYQVPCVQCTLYSLLVSCFELTLVTGSVLWMAVLMLLPYPVPTSIGSSRVVCSVLASSALNWYSRTILTGDPGRGCNFLEGGGPKTRCMAGPSRIGNCVCSQYTAHTARYKHVPVC
jgi:hypothetical protein